MGRTHGETVEQEWAYINLAALSTREMGPGARHSALDDSWGGWNWRKILGLGENPLKFCQLWDKILTVIRRVIACNKPRESGRDGIETAESGY